ncbi:MAG: hypothetical protein NC131_16095 [Roseburia sp.]|nr:hypothetical protein [Roseburia sp.]
MNKAKLMQLAAQNFGSPDSNPKLFFAEQEGDSLVFEWVADDGTDMVYVIVLGNNTYSSFNTDIDSYLEDEENSRYSEAAQRDYHPAEVHEVLNDFMAKCGWKYAEPKGSKSKAKPAKQKAVREKPVRQQKDKLVRQQKEKPVRQQKERPAKQQKSVRQSRKQQVEDEVTMTGAIVVAEDDQDITESDYMAGVESYEEDVTEKHTKRQKAEKQPKQKKEKRQKSNVKSGAYGTVKYTKKGKPIYPIGLCKLMTIAYIVLGFGSIWSDVSKVIKGINIFENNTLPLSIPIGILLILVALNIIRWKPTTKATVLFVIQILGCIILDLGFTGAMVAVKALGLSELLKNAMGNWLTILMVSGPVLTLLVIIIYILLMVNYKKKMRAYAGV